MDARKIKKIVNLLILKFIDALDNADYKLNDYCTILNVSDDSIRKWLNGDNIGKNSIIKIKNYYIKNFNNEEEVLHIFINYLLAQHEINFNKIHITKLHSLSKIEEILAYLENKSFITDFQKDTMLNISKSNIICYKEALYKKILNDMLKNSFYESSNPYDTSDNSIILTFYFQDTPYRVHVYLFDDILYTSYPKLKELKYQVKNLQDITSMIFLFINNLPEKERTDAYIIFTFNSYPQENLLALSSLSCPIYVKKISQDTLNKQITTLNYNISPLNNKLLNLINYNKFADYILNSLQCDFDLFFKNSLAKSNIINKNNLMDSTYKSFNQELEFEVHLLISELINIMKTSPIIKIMTINYDSYLVLNAALKALSNTIKDNNIIVQVAVTDNSSSLINCIKINNSNPNITFDFYSIKSLFLDYITSKKSLYNSLDLVVIGMGSLSFFKNPQRYFMYINAWLNNNGRILISSYSSSCKKLNYYKNILRKNLPFISGVSKDIGEYNLTKQKSIRIFCKTYDKNDLMQELKKYFEISKESDSNISKIYMHPTFSLFIEETIPREFSDALYKLEKEYSSSKNNRSNLGYFIVAIASKHIYSKQIIKTLPKIRKIKHNISISRGWHYSILKDIDTKYSNAILLKTVLLRSKSSNQLYCILISSDRILTEELRSNSLLITGCKKFISDELQLLTCKEINDLGYNIGNLNPFSKYGQTCKYFYDKNILKNETKYFIFGSGDPKFSYFVNQSQLKQLLDKYHFVKEEIITNYFELPNQ
ncbi:hypothetical protein [Thomasclavelia spiroformis]|uniref:hypothetical protein n=1 Tax=Thomasclavelia spiroformis TaxID=29348 RepID=UPI0026DAF5F2|nr:hypothetical protein [Thomasclavelia spiroformis]